MGAGTLYLVATPIGNLEDVTLRALRVLRETPHLYAEDTRRTRRLLDRHGIRARLRSLHAHNEAARLAEILGFLERGEDVALVSDAGTPLLSDPGERLVAAVLAAGCPVSPLPGASAVLAALIASGLSALPFAMVGFPPRRAAERLACFAELARRRETLVLFESPRRVAATLGELAATLGPERRACVARELTKLHESFARASLEALAAEFSEGARGEITLVVEGCGEPEPASAGKLDAALREALAAGLGPAEAARRVARELGVPRRDVYARALALRGAR
jgi:16S rRNA (cytidine1402-2'-O)-methyltransferase